MTRQTKQILKTIGLIVVLIIITLLCGVLETARIEQLGL